jgi:hypothetical protein
MIKSKIQLLDNPVITKVVQYGFLILIALIMFQFLGMTNRYIFFAGGDNATYFCLAQSIIQDHSYADISTCPPTPHTKYPFMFPLLISIVIFFFGENILLIKIIIIAGSATLMAGATALIWQDREDNYLAIIITLLVATVPLTVLYSSRLLSEIPYTAFSCLTILFAERALKINSIKDYHFILCVIFCIISYFTRSIGITLVFSIILAFILTPPVRTKYKQNFIKAIAIALPFFIGAGAWYFRGFILTRGKIKGYLQQFFTKNTYIVDSPKISIADIMERITTNVKLYTLELGDSLFPFSFNTYDQRIIIYGTIIFFIIMLGFIRVFKQRRGVPEYYLITYVTVILVWGFREKRFLIPLFPFLIYYLIKGIEGIAISVTSLFSQKIGTITKHTVIIAIAMIMLYSNIIQNIQTLSTTNKINNSKGFEINPSFQIITTDKDMNRMLRLALFLRNHSEPGAIILGRKPSLIYLASGRPTIGGPFANDPEDFISNLEKSNISYIIMDEFHPDLTNATISAVKSYPERFRMVYRIPDSNSMILRFVPDK